MYRVVEIGTQRYTRVAATDEPGAGGANHKYIVEVVPQQSNHPVTVLATVRFQDGPIKEAGVNGVHNEDLLAMVIDRLQAFQAGPYSCRENALALTKLEEALHWLNHRTNKRIARGVEGTHTV